LRMWVLLLAVAAGTAYPHSHEKGELQVRHPWARATPPGAKVAGAFMEIRNSGKQRDRLLSAATPVAARVEMHLTEREGEVLRMRQVKSFDVPAGSRLELKPGAHHLMLVDPLRPLQKGERFALTLRFERAGEIEVSVEVQDLGSRRPHH
jgi:periplasmic copper chaperone A